jgi:hypothetical protein
MRKSLLTTIAAAALIAGGGLAIAQTSAGGATGASQGSSQGSSQRSTGMGQTQNPSGTMQGPAEGRSGAIEQKEQRSGQPGAMKPEGQGRTGSEHMQGSTERRSGGVEQKEERQPGAMQPGSQGRMGTEQSKRGTFEQRSVTNLSSEQRTKLHQTIMSGNIHRADNVNLSLAVGTVVPQTVRVYNVPESIVVILPQYRGFKYIVVQSELIIVDPSSLEIVAILPV